MLVLTDSEFDSHVSVCIFMDVGKRRESLVFCSVFFQFVVSSSFSKVSFQELLFPVFFVLGVLLTNILFEGKNAGEETNRAVIMSPE